MVGCPDDVLLVAGRSAGLLGVDEPGSDPDAGSAKGKRHGETTAITDTTSGDDDDVLAGEGRLAALADVDDLGDQDRSRDLTSVATALRTLRQPTRVNQS